ncbi:MAG: hypothetical protein AAF438_15440, partial [Pseudomonadota bacterium]
GDAAKDRGRGKEWLRRIMNLTTGCAISPKANSSQSPTLRHSHHHVNVRRTYQTLEWFDDSPQLPTGYPELVLTAWIPALWRRRIDPLVPAVAVRNELT